jgi:hypothetical protein
LTPPRTLLGALVELPLVANPLWRRTAFAVVAAILALLCFWPERYEARAELTPQQGAGRLSALLSQVGGVAGLGALLGGGQAIDADLAIARSQAVLRDSLQQLTGPQRRRLGEGAAAEVRLRKVVDIAALRGNILQITALDGDPDFARAIVAAYVAAVQNRLSALSLQQVAQRRAIALNRVIEVGNRLQKAQATLRAYRSEHKLAAPELQLGAAVGLLATLEGKLEAAEVELRAATEYATTNNLRVQALQAQVAQLRGQIDQAQSAASANGTTTLGGMSEGTETYFNLYREVRIADALYQLYQRALEEVAVDELSTTTSISIMEPPYVVPERKYNVAPLGLLILTLMAAAGLEFYVIAPPIGKR